jgi:hypothetical protein
MIKSIIFSILTVISLFFLACAKTPFKKEDPLENTALVYLYVVAGSGINDMDRIPYYEVQINGKNTEGKVYPQEYLKYNLAADSVEISVARDVIEKKSIKLSLTRGEIYYLRVKSYSDGFAKYDFEVVAEKEALKEIKDTKYAIYENAEDLDILVKEESVKDKQKPAQVNKSKVEKIKDAYKLKEDGIITLEEFEKLKAEIINAD